MSFQIESFFGFFELKIFSTLKICPLWFPHGKLLKWNRYPKGNAMLPLSLSSKGQKSQWDKDREDELRPFLAAPKKKGGGGHETDSQT